ncbi:hypothetical protein [Synechococcus phage BUCT-ZZ01]|nr:hypothetical protein [Synechococcus phage BUCT-ZZ01]
MEQFKISKSIEEVIADAAHGYVSIPVKVQGFWSGDTIHIHVRRNRSMYTGGPGWKCSINQSSGGRDSKEVESDIQAYKNYGLALIEVANFCDILQHRTDEMEESFQQQLRITEEEIEKEEKAKRELIETDPALGRERAVELALKLREEGGVIDSFERASETKYTYIVYNLGLRSYYKVGRYGEVKISFAKMIDELANSSASRAAHSVAESV